MASQSAQERRAELIKMIEGRSDDEIIKGAEAMNTESVIENVAQGMVLAFKPEKAANKSAVIQYDVTTPAGSHSFQLKVGDGKCVLSKGTPEPARVTLTLALPNFLKLIAGKLNGQMAFMTGKLKMKGDLSVAMAMQSWFEQG